jgi:hypothetical protein
VTNYNEQKNRAYAVEAEGKVMGEREGKARRGWLISEIGN